MDGLLIFLTIFITLVCSVCTALLTPFRQLRLRVEQRFFKSIKFNGVSIIVPMFVLFVVGLLLTVLIWVLVPVLYYRVGIDLDVLVVIPVAVAVPYVIAEVLTEFLCVYISRNRQQEASTEHELEDAQPEVAVEEHPIEEIVPEEQVEAQLETQQVEEQPVEYEQVQEEFAEESPQEEQVETTDEQPTDGE